MDALCGTRSPVASLSSVVALRRFPCAPPPWGPLPVTAIVWRVPVLAVALSMLLRSSASVSYAPPSRFRLIALCIWLVGCVRRVCECVPCVPCRVCVCE